MIRPTLIFAICLSFGSIASADLLFTTEGNYDIGTESYQEGDIADYNQSTSTSTMMLDRDFITGGNNHVAAIHYLNSNQLILTADGGFDIGIDSYDQGDLVLYNTTTGSSSLFFDRDNITGGNREITAAFLTNNDSLIFTTNGNFDVGTDSYDRGDLVEYDLTAGTTTLFFDRDLITGGNRDITAAHVLADGNLLFTTRGNSDIGTASFERGDVILYDFGTGTASLYFDRDNITGGNRNITGFSVVPEPASWMLLLGLALFITLLWRRQSRAKVAA